MYKLNLNRIKCWWRGCNLDVKNVQGERIYFCTRCNKRSEDTEDSVFYKRFKYRHKTLYSIITPLPTILLFTSLAILLIFVISWFITSLNSYPTDVDICKATALVNNLEYYYDDTVGCLIKYEDFFVQPR